MSGTVLLSLENGLFRTFAFYVAILLLKTVAMSALTVYYRVTRNKFRSAEDYKFVGSTKPFTGPQSDFDIDRVVRIHAHDIENILPFIFIGILYILTDPNVTIATWLFRIYTGGRLMHTFVYYFAIPQPARLLAFAVSYAVHVIIIMATITSLL